ncbi:hypothetical protein [uncultured Paraglaciecola sp.]|uniref:hypothetical protein n=1 Tax=uncultured Paraglaciecola sp. TaxID=1765024 RepID=UPI002618CEF5|nr:hypothetical protein [uncultured Paraglaciecola sp.]
MKTTYTIIAILASVFFMQTATAKLANTGSSVQLKSPIAVNVEAEIVSNINNMLSNMQSPSVAKDATKQLELETVQFNANELVQNVSKNLPEFKFKVILAD